MHCCASSAAKEEALIPWTRDPSGRLQSRKKSEFRRRTYLPCHVSTVQIGARSGKTGSQLAQAPSRANFGIVVPIRLDSRSDRIASACRLSGPFGKSQALDASASNAAQCRFGSSKTDLKGRSASGAKPTLAEASSAIARRFSAYSTKFDRR